MGRVSIRWPTPCTFYIGYSVPVGEVLLVAHDHTERRVFLVLVVEFHPLEEVFEGLEVGEVIDEEAEVGILEVAGDETLEALLASCIPELEAVGFVLMD